MKKKATKKEEKVPVGQKRKKSTLVRKKKDNTVDYELLLKFAPGLYLILDPDFTIVAVNDAYLSATMTQRESIVGRALFDIFPDNPDDYTANGVSNLRASLEYALQNKKPHVMAVQKYDIRTPSGVFEERYWSPLNTPVINAQNEVIYIIHNVTDVTEHHTTDQKLKRSEKDYQLLVESVKDYAIFMVDTKGCIASWNSGAQNIKGYTAEEIIGKPIEVFYPADEIQRDEAKRNLQMAIQHGRYETDGWRLRKDGSRFYANIIFTCLYDQAGHHYGFAKVTRDITERRKAEEHIRFLATMADNIQDPIIASDNNFCTTHWNKAAEKLFGWTSEEVLGKPTREVLDIIYPGNSREQILQSFTKNGYWQGEVIYHAKSGRPIHILATSSQLKDVNETSSGVLVLAKDISERKESEKQLEEFKHFFNNSHDLCGIANEGGFFETINANFSNVLGYSKEELYEIPFIQLVHPDDIASTLLEYEKLKVGESTVNFINRYRKKDGTYVYLDWNATPNPVTGKLYCDARDITQRKIIETSLKESEEQIHTIFKNAPDAVVVIDADGKVIRWNPRAETIFGWQAEEVNGKYLHELIIPHEFREAHVTGMRHFLKTGIGPVLNRQVEMPALRKDNTTFEAGLSISPTLMNGQPAFIGFINDITVRKKAEEALNKLNEELELRVKDRTAEIYKRERRFRGLIENSYDVVSLLDESFTFSYSSPSAKRVLGWANEELENLSITSNVHPDDLEYLHGITERVKKNPEKSVQVMFRNKHKSGHYLWLEGSIVNWLQDETLNAIVFNFRDVTKRKELEELLHKANTLARIGGWEVDLIKGTMYWSKITREIHETSNDFVPDLTSGINFYKEGWARDLITQKVKEAIELGKPWDVELQIVTAKNNERWVRSIGETEVIDGKSVRFYGSFQDIDKRKRAEEKLNESEKLYRSIYENTGEAILLTIPNGSIISANAIACQMFDRTEEEICRLGRSGLVNSLDPHVSAGLEERKKTGLLRDEWTFIKRDGTIFSGEVTSTIFKNSDGEERSITIIRDITERKKVEEKIKNLNSELEEKVIKRTEQLELANKELEAFSYSVSHDLRAPLRAVSGYAKMLQEDYTAVLDENANRLIDIVRQNAKQMGQLIDDLLAFSRLGRKEIRKETINMTELVKLVVKEVQVLYPRAEIKFNSLQAIYGDTALIKQVLLNYISNAAKYSYKKEHPLIEIKSDLGNKEIIFSVSDNGAGFNMEYSHKLFNVFQRLHRQEEFEGTGVGLAIVSRILTKHGGRVWAQSEVEKGATFYFSLPQTQQDH